MQIREARLPDAAGICRVHLSAFDAKEASFVAGLADRLLRDPLTPATLNLIAEIETDSRLVGHVAFSPVWKKGQKDLAGYILAPLAVSPDQHRVGIGKALVQAGLAAMRNQAVPMVFVYGDPEYYGRFGFAAPLAAPFFAPFPLKYPSGWQAVALSGKENEGSAPAELECVPALNQAELW